MRRILAAVVSTAFVLSAGSAFADDMAKGGMKKDAMKHESMAKNKKGEMKKDAMAKKDAAKDKMKK